MSPSSDVEILGSVEVRWFSIGDDPGLREWFARAFPDAAQEPMRADDYLVVPKMSFVGIKLRGYPPRDGSSTGSLNLEFKLRESELGVRRVAPNVVGRVERWRKWSAQVGVDAGGYASHLTGEHGNWNRIEKTRTMQRFAFQSGRLTTAPAQERLREGCGVELTKLTPRYSVHPQANWTSLAIEAFAEPGGTDPEAIVTRAMEDLLRLPSTVALSEDRSSSYPAWLRALSPWE